MSLLKEFARQCVILVPTQEEDGEGGFKTTYVDGEAFEAYQALNNTGETTKAEKNALNSVYAMLIDKSVNLHYEDYFRDEATGLTYRVTTEPEQKKSPSCATFSLKYCEAEKKAVPT